MSILPIPPLQTATDPIHSPADLRERWRALVGPLDFDEPRIWLTFVAADRRMYKVLTEIPVDREPDRGAVLDLLSALSGLLVEFDEQPRWRCCSPGPAMIRPVRRTGVGRRR